MFMNRMLFVFFLLFFKLLLNLSLRFMVLCCLGDIFRDFRFLISDYKFSNTVIT